MGLKIEVGGYYLRKDGRKFYIVGKTPERLDLDNAITNGRSFIGIAEDEENFWVFSPNGEAVHPKDNLVAEWKEPKRIKGWVNVYVTPYVTSFDGPYETREEAEKANEGAIGREYRVACIKIDVLEGQGLEEGA